MRAQAVSQKYSTSQWDDLVSDFWQRQQAQLTNPLTIASSHHEFQCQLAEAEHTLNSWLENQRDDFERQRSRYETALVQVGLSISLRIPFDQQRPEESYSALADIVYQEISRHLVGLQNKLNQVLQKARYAMQVQQVDLANVEADTDNALQSLAQLRKHLTPALLRDIERAEREILQPMGGFGQRYENLATAVQQALRKQSPSSSEKYLLELLQANSGQGEVDLYGLIMLMLDQEDQPVELVELMGNLRGLFQKNQIGMRIRLL